MTNSPTGSRRGLRHRNDSYRDLVENSLDCICTHNLEGTILSVNAAFVRSAEAAQASDLVGTSIVDLLDKRDVRSFQPYIEQLVSAGVAEGLMRIETRRGNTRIFEYRNTMRGHGGDAVVLGLARDVTSSFGATRMLAESENRFRTLFTKNLAGVLISTIQGEVIEANDVAARTLGFATPGELVRMQIGDLQASQDEWERMANLLLVSGEASMVETRLFRRDQSPIWVVLNCSLIDFGRPLGNVVVTTFRDITSYKALEEQMVERLRQSEHDYRTLFEEAHDPILVLQPGTEVVLDANRAACRTYGLTKEALVGRSMLEFSLPDSPDRSAEVLALKGEFIHFSTMQRRADGSAVAIDATAGPILYRGAPAILSINHDVSLARKIEAERNRAFAILSAMKRSTDFGVLVLSNEHEVLMSNERCSMLWNLPPGALTAEELRAHILAQSVDTCRAELMANAYMGPPEMEYTGILRLHDGRQLECSVYPLILDEVIAGKVVRFFDVTNRESLAEQKRNEVERLSAIAREWTSIYEAVSHPIVVLDGTLRIRRANRAAISLLQLDGQPVAGVALLEKNDVEPWHSVLALCKGEKEASAEIVDEVEGRIWDLSLSVQSAERPEDRILIAILRDVTATHEMRQSLQRVQRMSEVGELLTGVLHEVRNPLFGISATVDALEARSVDCGHAQHIDRLRAEVTRLRTLMNDLLEFGTLREPEMSEVSLDQIIDESMAACHDLAVSHGVTLQKVARSVGMRVSADANRLRQVFDNIVQNAIQHSPSGGTVRIRIEEEERRNTKWIAFSIEDEGRGLAPGDLRRAFEPFFTKRRGGTGLGLSIVRRIVEQHGGTVEIANLPGRGAAVRIALRA